MYTYLRLTSQKFSHRVSSPVAPFVLRVPFYLFIGVDKGTQKENGQQGTTGNLVDAKPA